MRRMEREFQADMERALAALRRAVEARAESLRRRGASQASMGVASEMWEGSGDGWGW